ncbi:hypothetical protein BH11BAC2_BH11BAC2_12140 [soil metagenome]
MYDPAFDLVFPHNFASVKKGLFLLIVFCTFFHGRMHGQNVLDSLTLSQQKVFRSLAAAQLQPDSVFRLDLSKKKLKSLPEEIKNFKNLQELKISRNDLKELPEWIGDLQNLTSLDASNNELAALPPEIGKLKNLVFLGLNRNIIESLPHEIGMLSKLEIIEMWDNELDSIPDEMKNLHSLRVFELRGILFTESAQRQIEELLPDTQIYFSPSCNCGD